MPVVREQVETDRHTHTHTDTQTKYIYHNPCCYVWQGLTTEAGPTHEKKGLSRNTIEAMYAGMYKKSLER